MGKKCDSELNMCDLSKEVCKCDGCDQFMKCSLCPKYGCQNHSIKVEE